MSIENTNTIAGLDTTNPRGVDPIFEGPQHFSLIKRVLKQVFPGAAGLGFAKPITASEDDLNYSKNLASDTATANKSLVDIIKTMQTQINNLTGTGTGSLQNMYPIGCIYTTVNPTNPGTILGFGTWTAIAAGRCLVGVDTVAPFNTVRATGGAKDAVVPTHTHTATIAASGGHQHTYQRPNFAQYIAPGAGSNLFTGFTDQKTGVGGVAGNEGDHTHTVAVAAAGVAVANQNLQPYYTVYFFERTA